VIVIGLMSGTSVDSIDGAVAEIRGAPPHLEVAQRAFVSCPIAPALRERIFRCFRPETGGVDEVCALNFAIGEAFAEAARAAAAAAGLTLAEVDLIASHGQTVWHAVRSDGAVDSTLQLGSGAVIAERTGVTTVSDLRSRDVAAGGQGAPLVPFSERLLYADPQLCRALQNIGGIANVTILPKGDAPAIAFDTGPGNMVIDALVRLATGGQAQYDEDGRMAAAGSVSQTLLSELMAHPYLAMRPPKSTGRELFGEPFAQQLWARGLELGLSPADIVATATAFTAASIALACRTFSPCPIDQMVVGGGGALNPTLMRLLREAMAPVAVLRQEDLGFSSKAKEALAFAIMGYETLHGRPSNLPSCTGARRAVPLGQIAPGDNYLALLRSVLGAGAGPESAMAG